MTSSWDPGSWELTMMGDVEVQRPLANHEVLLGPLL